MGPSTTTEGSDGLAARLAAIEAQLGRIDERLALSPDQQRKEPPGRRVKSPEPAFRRLAKRIAADGRTLLGEDRLWILWQSARNVAPLGLPAAEVGTYLGGSARFLAAALRESAGRELDLHVIDTFAGHPEAALGERDPEAHVPGLFGDTDVAEVRAYLAEFERTHVHQGAFADVRDRLPDGPYGFAHLDVDLYEPMLDCLRFFDPRLAPGGVLVLDDFDARKCPGVRQAMEAWLPDATGRYHVLKPLTEQVVMTKLA